MSWPWIWRTAMGEGCGCLERSFAARVESTAEAEAAVCVGMLIVPGPSVLEAMIDEWKAAGVRTWLVAAFEL
jgi:hypothetical protein